MESVTGVPRRRCCSTVRLPGSSPDNVNPRYKVNDIAEVVGDCDAAALIHEPVAAADATHTAELLDRPPLQAVSVEYQRAHAGARLARGLSEQTQILWYTGGTTRHPQVCDLGGPHD